MPLLNEIMSQPHVLCIYCLWVRFMCVVSCYFLLVQTLTDNLTPRCLLYVKFELERTHNQKD